jgi:hypothetical protein
VSCEKSSLGERDGAGVEVREMIELEFFYTQGRNLE